MKKKLNQDEIPRLFRSVSIKEAMKLQKELMKSLRNIARSDKESPKPNKK